MSLPNPYYKKPTSPTEKPILRAQIVEAQRHTNSNRAAARYLNVTYKRYRKYAKLYDLFDQHLNEAGVGLDKGWSKNPKAIPLSEILANQHPTYSRAKLKNRLIARKKLLPQCALCGFHEARILDKQVPLMLSFRDGNTKNMALANLQLLCYNCTFLTQGAPVATYPHGLEPSLDPTRATPYRAAIPPVRSDAADPEDEQLYDMLLSDEERAQWLEEVHRTTSRHDRLENS